MSKMGVYGFLRILLPIFGPQMQRVLTPLLWLAVATVVLSAYAALAQKDLKRIFAYSSINHLGYCLLGDLRRRQIHRRQTPRSPPRSIAAMNGVFLQMFNHGLTAATLFWFIALLEKRSGGLRGLDDFGGLRKVAPVFTGLMGIALFSSLGLPGLNGFIGEFLIFKGSFPLVTWATRSRSSACWSPQSSSSASSSASSPARSIRRGQPFPDLTTARAADARARHRTYVRSRPLSPADSRSRQQHRHPDGAATAVLIGTSRLCSLGRSTSRFSEPCCCSCCPSAAPRWRASSRC